MKETKADLYAKLTRLEADNAALRAKVALLESEPGVFQSSWNRGAHFVARPIPNGLEWNLIEAGHELLLNGDWDCREDMTHTQLVEDQWDRLPPGINHLIVRYSYSNENGICVDKAWPAVQFPGTDEAT